MNQSRKTLMSLMSAAALALGAQQAGAVTNIISANITTDTTWYGTNTYVLDRLIFVQAGATLKIEPGTVIRGLPELGSGDPGTPLQQPGTLVVSRGAKIDARGTAQNPIVFTDQYDDNIGSNPGSVGPNGVNYGKLNNQLTGQWGGLIIAGKTYITWDGLEPTYYPPNSNIWAAVEGLTSTNGDINYGGGDDLDNSGILDYVSIRYGGYILGPTKEINGLTLCGVGRGTYLNHIDIYQTKDDAVECFGGTCGIKHLITWNGTDDAIDTDTGFRGKIQFALVVQGVCTNPWKGVAPQNADSSDKGLEWDGAGDSTGYNDNPASCGTMFNFTLIGLGTNVGDKANTAMNIRHNAGGRIYNGIIMDFAGGCTLIEGVTNRYQAGVTNAAWPYGQNCSAMKLFETYAQDTNVLSNYIGYDVPIAGSTFLDLYSLIFWEMGTPYSVGLATNATVDEFKIWLGNDNYGQFGGHAHAGAVPYNTGYDILSNWAGFYPAAYLAEAATPPRGLGGFTRPSLTPINYYERETNAYTFKPTFRTNSFTYTCVKKIDPRCNQAFWSVLQNWCANGPRAGFTPPKDGFFNQVTYPGAMGQYNWAADWSTAWRLGGMETNIATWKGDDPGIVPTIRDAANSVNIGLAVGSYENIPADWYMVALGGPAGLYVLNSSFAWVPWTSFPAGGVVLPNTPLFNVPYPVNIPLGGAGLPNGSYTVYFAIDTIPNGELDLTDATALGFVPSTVP